MMIQNEYSEKVRATVLTAVILLSVVSGSTVFVGPAAADHSSGEQVVSDGEGVYQGEKIVIEGMTPLSSRSETVDLYEGSADVDDPTWIREVDVNTTADPNEVYIDTSELDQGDYHLKGGSRTHNFSVRDHTLNASFDSTTVGQDGRSTLTIDSPRANFLAEISVDGIDKSQLEQMISGAETQYEHDGYVVVKARGDFTVDFSQADVAPGEYNFSVESADTTASDTATVTVEKSVQSISFTQTAYRGPIGNEVEFTMTTEGINDDIFVRVGDEDRVNYEAILEIQNMDQVEDGEEITIAFNTVNDPNKGEGEGMGAGWYVTESDATVNYVHPVQNATAPLDPADYEITAGTQYWANNELENQKDTAYLTLTEHSSFGGSPATMVTAPSDTVSSSDDIGTATLTETNALAKEDEMLVKVEAEGVYGYVYNDTESWKIPGMQVKVKEQDSKMNAQPREWGTWYGGGLGAKVVHVDEESGEFIMALKQYEEIPAGQKYDVTVEFGPDNPFVDSWDNAQKATTSFEYKERTVKFDDSAAEVSATTDATVSGTTTIAPGSQITTHARASGIFVDDAETTVKPSDGENTFAATYDFSGEKAGTEFDLSANGPMSSTYDAESASITSKLVEDTTGSEPVLTEISFGQATYTVTKNESKEVTVDVTAGTDGLSGDVLLKLDGSEIGSQSVNLSAEDSTQLTYTVDTSGEDYTVGDHTLTVQVNENISATATLTVEAAKDEKGDNGTSDNADNGTSDNGDNGTSDNGDNGTSDNGESTDNGDSGEDGGSSDSDQPGFGIAVAMLSLLGAAMFALRKRE